MAPTEQDPQKKYFWLIFVVVPISAAIIGILKFDKNEDTKLFKSHLTYVIERKEYDKDRIFDNYASDIHSLYSGTKSFIKGLEDGKTYKHREEFLTLAFDASNSFRLKAGRYIPKFGEKGGEHNEKGWQSVTIPNLYEKIVSDLKRDFDRDTVDATQYLRRLDAWLNKSTGSTISRMEFKIDSRNSEPIETEVLEKDKIFCMTASGKYFAGDNIEADADYSISNNIPTDTWTDIVTGYENRPRELLDLVIYKGPGKYESINWGKYNKEHIYSYEVTGDNKRLSLLILDESKENNEGSVAVSIKEGRCS